MKGTVVTAEEVAELFTRTDGAYVFARWARLFFDHDRASMCRAPAVPIQRLH